MSEKISIPKQLAIIAGNGVYPLLLAESARAQGVERIVAAAFKGEAPRRLADAVDEIHWLRVGALGRLKEILLSTHSTHAVMAGQITPTALFTAFPDSEMIALLKSLKEKNAHTIFGAACENLAKHHITMLPASAFMEKHMPDTGTLTAREPNETEASDIQLGLEVAEKTSDLDIGQTVVIKEGTILAVEAFEGTDKTILRAGKLGGPGSAIIKRAKPGHDMRFDIPVIGLRTLKSMKKAGSTALAIEEQRSIILERDRVIQRANELDIALYVYPETA